MRILALLLGIYIGTGVATKPVSAFSLREVLEGANASGLPPPLLDRLGEIEKLEKELDERDRRKAEGRMLPLNPKGLMIWNNWWHKLNLNICFFGGSTNLRDYFIEIASEWQKGTALTLDFGKKSDGFNSCSPTNSGDIRVSFNKAGNWSYVGRSARKRPIDTMTLNIDIPQAENFSLSDVPHYRKVHIATAIRHEFGHALGLEHEHQHPDSKCEEHFDMDEIVTYFRKKAYNNEKAIKRYVLTLTGKRLAKTRYDKKSIMHYDFLPDLFKDGEGADCYLRERNTKISPTDLRFIKARYGTR